MSKAPRRSAAAALDALRAEAARCTDCPLFARATQTVFGEGPSDAAVMIVGEQPGDHEDRTGHPFVGPAGALLDRALGDAGLDRTRVYVTNAVKHFKWKAAGKVRLHQTPTASEVTACSKWWRAELDVVDPRVLVLLGATAAQAVLGPGTRVNRDRGRLLPTGAAAPALVTLHPAAVLRATAHEREVSYAGLVADLQVASEFARSA